MPRTAPRWNRWSSIFSSPRSSIPGSTSTKNSSGIATAGRSDSSSLLISHTQIEELHERVLVEEVHPASGTISVLGDDDVGDVWPLGVSVVHHVAVDKEHDVRVL